MKLALIVLISYSFIATALLEARKPCAEDNCWRALWGSGSGSDTDRPFSAFTDCQKYMTTTVVVYPITTTTVTRRSISSVGAACSTSLTDPIGTVPSSSRTAATRTSSRSSSMGTTTLTGLPRPSGSSSLSSSSRSSEYVSLGEPVWTFEDIVEPTAETGEPIESATETDEAVDETAKRRVRRQTSTDMPAPTPVYRTSTFVGPVPAYVTPGCADAQYASACDCKEVTRDEITLSSTTLTDTTTTTSWSYLTATSSPCETSSGVATTSSVSSASPPTCTGLGLVTCEGGDCIDTKNDLQNCGSCGNECNEGFDCINGVCARAPCDSNCSWDRMCGASNGTATSSCICATEAEGHGICFDKDRFACADARVKRCLTTTAQVGGCPIGFACIKDYCNCGGGGSALGICVSTVGCRGAEVGELGPLVRVGEMEQRRRTARSFGL